VAGRLEVFAFSSSWLAIIARFGSTRRSRDDRRDDYEHLTGMQLTDEELETLVSAGGECVFNWTN